MSFVVVPPATALIVHGPWQQAMVGHFLSDDKRAGRYFTDNEEINARQQIGCVRWLDRTNPGGSYALHANPGALHILTWELLPRSQLVPSRL